MIAFRVASNNRPEDAERDGEVVSRIVGLEESADGPIIMRYVDLEGDRCELEIPFGQHVQVYH